MGKTLILYASTTGNTQMVAQTIFKVLTGNGKTVDIKNVSENPEVHFQEYDTLLIGASTWDEGLINYLMTDFLVSYFSNPENTNLTGKKFTAFGCGESTYEHFCEAIPKLEEMFGKYGVQVLQQGLKIDFDPQTEENLKMTEEWAAKLLPLL